jgi:hypothetical protein
MTALVDTLQNKIKNIEAKMSQMPQAEIETRHYFADGIYAREIMIPAGTLLTGAVHSKGHINIISQGDITVYTDEGIQRLTAPCTVVTAPGSKRIGYAHENTVWVTMIATEETDIEVIENTIVDMKVSDLLLEVD